MSGRLLNWRAVRKGETLRGFASVELPSGMILHEVAVHLAANRRGWASPPARPLLDRDGRHMRDANGKGRWAPLIEFATRERSDAFSALVLRLVGEDHPGDLEHGEAAHA
jgi:hypothetical protein